MKTRNLFILAIMIMAIVMASCSKDPAVPTGKVFLAAVEAGDLSGSGIYNGHAYVDLGLPSGLLWATCNIGATTSVGCGDYFAWGETYPKSDYSWKTYKHAYCNGDATQMKKYCHQSYFGYNGYTDNLTILQAGDDAAITNWGGGWRMPTWEEWEELKDNTTSIWTSEKGVMGRLFTGPNGNSLFLSVTGYYKEKDLIHPDDYGDYWSSTLTTSSFNAYSCGISSDYVNYPLSNRYYGMPIRPVYPAER